MSAVSTPTRSTRCEYSARELIRLGQSGALAICNKHGAPIVDSVDIATDTNGAPVFALQRDASVFSQLQTRPECGLLVEPLVSGDFDRRQRVSIRGSAFPVGTQSIERVQSRFARKHTMLPSDFFKTHSMWRLEISHATLAGGTSGPRELKRADLLVDLENWEAWHLMEHGAVEHMNDDHADATALYATVLCNQPTGDWRITGLDPEGIDMACGEFHERLTYQTPLETAAALRPTLVELVKHARQSN